MSQAPAAGAGRSHSPQFFQRWLYVVGGVVATATILSVTLPAEWKWISGSAGALAVFLGIFMTAKKSVAETRLRDAAEKRESDARQLARAERERSAVLFEYNLREVLNSVDGLARLAPAERAREVPAVRQSVAVQSKEGVSAPASRAAYFRVEDLLALPRTMKADKVASSPDRHDRFGDGFDEQDGSNVEAWEILDGKREPLLVEDVAAWDAQRGIERRREYGTFVTASVRGGEIPFGILSVNALEPGSLVRDDLIFVEALARILGIVELLCMTSTGYARALEAHRRRAAQ